MPYDDHIQLFIESSKKSQELSLTNGYSRKEEPAHSLWD